MPALPIQLALLTLTLTCASTWASAQESASAPRALDVVLSLELVPAPRMQVEVTLVGEQDGTTVLGVSEDWGGVPETAVVDNLLAADYVLEDEYISEIGGRTFQQ